MEILQQFLALLPNWNSFVSTVEALSMPFLIMFVSCSITTLTYLCRILGNLMSFCVRFLKKVKTKLQPHQAAKLQKQYLKLQQELRSLQAQLPLNNEEVKKDESSRLFTIQR